MTLRCLRLDALVSVFISICIFMPLRYSAPFLLVLLADDILP